MSTSTASANRVIRLPELKRRLSVGTDTVYRMIRHGQLPRPIKISKAASGWIESEIDEFIARRVAERDARGDA